MREIFRAKRFLGGTYEVVVSVVMIQNTAEYYLRPIFFAKKRFGLGFSFSVF